MRVPDKPPFDINTMLHRKVRYVLDKQGDLQDALLDIVTQGKKEWSVQEWQQLVDDIQASDLTVGEYIGGYV
jgi:hypothetical protein